MWGMDMIYGCQWESGTKILCVEILSRITLMDGFWKHQQLRVNCLDENKNGKGVIRI